MKRIFGVLVSVLLVIMFSCEYKTDEIFLREVDKNVSPPDITVNLNLYSDTTYFYTNSFYLNLSLTLTNKEIYDVKFFVDNVEVENVYKNSQDYSISIDASGKSMLKVKAEIYTSTETGSIADKINTESFVIQTKEWVLIHETGNPVLTTEIVDGRLKLSWTPIKSSVKSRYYIYSSRASNYLMDSTFNNWYIDSSFFGGTNWITITYGANDNSGYSIYGEFTYPLPDAKINNKNSYLISWEKSKFYNCINGYRILIGNDTIELSSSKDSYVYKQGIFGNNYLIMLELILKNTSYNNNSKYSGFANLLAYYPISFLPEYSFFTVDYFPLTGNSFYYMERINNQLYLNKFSLATKSVLASKYLRINDFSVSPNNKYIFYEDESNNLILLETNNLGLISSIPSNQIVTYPGILKFVISDEGSTVFFDQSKKVMIVYDILHKKQIAEVLFERYLSQFKISAGGKYIFIPEINALFQVVNNYCTEVWKYESSNQFPFFEFFPENQEKICLYDGSTFYVKNCTDFSTIYSFTIGDKNIINVDFTNQKILSLDGNIYYIYSLTTGDLLHTIPTSNYYPEAVRLLNDYIISDNCQFDLKYHSR